MHPSRQHRSRAAVGIALVWLCTCTFAIKPCAAESEGLDVKRQMETVKPHPRLFFTDETAKQLQEQIARDDQVRQVWEGVRLSAEHMLSEPPVRYQKEGRRLLSRSREALKRLTHLSMAARISGDDRFVARAVKEMQAAADMPDWNPSHFLDTAEMTLAVAIGYDWLYSKLTPENRAAFRAAIETKGLAPYLDRKKPQSWEKGGNNWNQVCHAGMVAGALALLEDDQPRAAEVVSRALQGLPHAMKVYEPDGTYPEGPGYWNYGTTFNVALISMLESALGTDFGLSQRPGFLKTGDFPLQMTGQTVKYYNFSDCGAGVSFSPAMTWFASRTHRPELLWFEEGLLQKELKEIRESQGKNQADRFFPLVLLWEDPGMKRTEPAIRNWYGQGPNPLVVFRASWSDPNALYLAIKAGSPGASHAHMDIGSFVLESDGIRWSLDLGSQGYNEMEQRGLDIWNNRPGSDRWRIFRYHNRAHSTLLVDDQEQVVKSNAAFSEVSLEPERRHATVDLSETYRGQLAHAVRRFTVESDNSVLIDDQIEAGSKAASVRWAMVTPATLQPDGDSRAWLNKNGKRLRLDVLSPANAKITSWVADPPPHDFDERNPGVTIVGFTAMVSTGEKATLSVRLSRGDR